jgi:hypothetical protein
MNVKGVIVTVKKVMNAAMGGMVLVVPIRPARVASVENDRKA